jgi:hypothetical protein
MYLTQVIILFKYTIYWLKMIVFQKLTLYLVVWIFYQNKLNLTKFKIIINFSSFLNKYVMYNGISTFYNRASNWSTTV